MICYRVVRRKYADLRGDGARLYGGRFNPPGVPAVYTSQSIALALLEVLVHIDKSEVPRDYVVMAIQLEGRQVYRLRSGTPEIRQFASDRFKDSQYYRPILRVQSVIVPRENNYVLFPEANGFEANTVWIEDLNFDARLFALMQG